MSLDPYREQLQSTIDTYTASLASWKTRRKVFTGLLDVWGQFGQLKSSPIDTMRIDFIDGEIKKQTDKLRQCQENYAKFEELEAQMRLLAPSKEDVSLANDEDLMEIREELDDDDNVIKSTVRPHHQDLEEMAGIVDEMEEDEDEDEYGRSKHPIPVPESLRKKKKIVFADELVQGPSSSTGTPAKSVLKKTKSPVQPESKVPAKSIVGDIVEHDRLFPKKINLATQDFAPDEGVEKKAMIVPVLTAEERAVIAQKRAALGKKHRRRKSADPNYPVRSSSWDDSQPMPAKLVRSQSFSNTVQARVDELIAAKEDIAWANEPITPDLSPEVASPQPRKPGNVPSPLSSEVTELSPSEVTEKLAPLTKNSVPSVVRKPKRQSSVDPMTITPTRGSPPPESRSALLTEEEGSINHTMVRSTPKSPPPDVAIHDLNAAIIDEEHQQEIEAEYNRLKPKISLFKSRR